MPDRAPLPETLDEPSIFDFAVWLADRAGFDFAECDPNEQEAQLWSAEAIFSEVKRRLKATARPESDLREAADAVIEAAEILNLNAYRHDEHTQCVDNVDYDRLRESLAHYDSISGRDSIEGGEG